MNRIALFEAAQAKAETLRVRYPDVKTLESIIRQIDYLMALEKGISSDRSRLKEIVLGVQATREIEPLDSDLAEMLYAVNEQAQEL
jgi:Tsi6